MPKISSYNTVTPQGDDKIIISQTNGTPSNSTKNITIDELKGYIQDIPTPYVYAIKKVNDGLSTFMGPSIGIQKPTQTAWLSKNPRLFMFRYKKQRNKLDQDTLEYNMQKTNFVHPSHLNGTYTEANFPGSNWGNSIQEGTNAIGILFPIVTEWDINSELKIAKTGSLITDFASLRPATYIEIPFNPLQFLWDSTNTEMTSLPAVTSDDFWRTRCTVQRASHNIRPSVDSTDYHSSAIIMKFAIGIPNPLWTNTNHKLPYIMGALSNAIQLKYMYNQENNADVQQYSITQGSGGPAGRYSN